MRDLGSLSSDVLGYSRSSQGMCSWSTVAGEWLGFPAGADTAPRHWDMVCSSLGVFPPVKCLNLFDGTFIQHYFCGGGFLCGGDAKVKHF